LKSKFWSGKTLMSSGQLNLGPKVVIAGLFTFPCGSASASRVRNLALGLIETGASVHVISMAPSSPALIQEATTRQNTYHGISYEFSSPYSPPRAAVGPLAPARHLARRLIWLKRLYASVEPARQSLERLILAGRCDFFWGYGRMYSVIRPLLRSCQRHSIAGIVDVVETPGSCTGFGGRLSPIWWEEKLGSVYFARHCDGLTTITTTLKEYYEKRGAEKILVLPSLAERADVHDPPIHDAAQPFTLAYVGALLDRDNPGLMFEVVRELSATGYHIRLQVFGRYHAHAAGRRWQEWCRIEPSLRGVVEFVGALSDERLCESVRKADALILMRRNRAGERASFPTRLVEYLGYGLPVFVSEVGDIPRYLEDAKHAILLAGEDPRAIASTMGPVITSPDRGRALGLRGKLQGEACFDRTLHARRLLQFAAELRAQPGFKNRSL
jgi:glycosyltransferase involved in cell wall biosynthesis